MSRPEEVAPPEVFYDATEAGKYLHSTRMIDVQSQMAERAVEMLCLPEGRPCMILDVGCGTGLSGETLEEDGHQWVGIDISRDMLDVAQEREVEGDLVHQDMGLGMPFREGVFDGAISISAIQWLCYSDRNGYDPRKRLLVFFQSLYKSLRRGGRAALQFYPQARRRTPSSPTPTPAPPLSPPMTPPTRRLLALRHERPTPIAAGCPAAAADHRERHARRLRRRAGGGLSALDQGQEVLPGPAGRPARPRVCHAQRAGRGRTERGGRQLGTGAARRDPRGDPAAT